MDYNSFLMGVLTGLKLGREPMIPPPPSDSYILTEDYEVVLDENGTALITE